MVEEEQKPSEEVAPQGVPTSPAGERFQGLAELEEQIRRRLRSNQRFLERFLDEDFVDDEADAEDAEEGEEEEL